MPSRWRKQCFCFQTNIKWMIMTQILDQNASWTQRNDNKWNHWIQDSNNQDVLMLIGLGKFLLFWQLFGRQLPDNNVWVDGVVSKWLRDSTLTHDTMAELLTSQFSDKQRIARMMGSLSHVKKWLVLDGPMDDTWLENMGTLLDSTRALNLASGETISQPGELKLSFNVSILVVGGINFLVFAKTWNGLPLEALGWFSNRTERQLTTACANQTTGLTNGCAANWALEVEFSPFCALFRRQMTFPFCC